MKLIDAIGSLPEKLKQRFQLSRVEQVDLETRIRICKEVTAIIATPGMEAIRKEQDDFDKLLLEAVSGADDENPVRSWEDYWLARGRLEGFRLRANIPGQLMRQGLEAEMELNRRTGQK